jgi:CHAT domain-containing protein
LLRLGEILTLKLDADWVVLSACNTAAAGGRGSEAVSGLGRAFFFAGARALLVSNWAVESHSARSITTGLFRRQAGAGNLSRARALQASTLDLLDNGAFIDRATGRAAYAYAHPIFWAPFSLVGDAGG